MVTGYREIAEQLRARIEGDELRPGAPLPSEAELMAAHGVARQTARRALALLEADGTVIARPGVGRFVAGDDMSLVPAPAVPTPVRRTRAEAIADELRARIDSGELVSGEALPSESELAATHDVGRGTARRAFAILESEGVLITRPGATRQVAP